MINSVLLTLFFAGMMLPLLVFGQADVFSGLTVPEDKPVGADFSSNQPTEDGMTGDLGSGVETDLRPGATSGGMPNFANSDEIISAGDVVRIVMLEDSQVQYEGHVAVSGTVPIPYYGEFRIADLTQQEASETLEEELEKNLYQRATVSVSLLQRGPGQVYIYGAVGRPGGVQVPRYGNLTILRLIFASGGLTGWAAPEDAFILRQNPREGEERRISVNLSELFATVIPDSDRDVTLRDGDIVCVPGLNGELYQFMSAAEREILVMGEVGSPGPIRFGPGELRTVMRAIFKAGGFGQFAKKDAVRIIRYERDQTRSEMVVNVEEIMEKGFLHKDVELQPGDMLIVDQKRVNW
ncbi:MAG: SLBB domain-containing protein [Candidatus Pacebacteria bacterium]|nr:SLBB domain-containing protein [Candidatus Paceibacterota bacterium]